MVMFCASPLFVWVLNIGWPVEGWVGRGEYSSAGGADAVQAALCDGMEGSDEDA